ncbi:Modification methylase DpnIIB [Limihaloglobus sulfuriphilus]|uniref:Methyltransferase n=1 Tax=Limihaloglobus sulfuriphilus TaxID=1851148 RepID=A0A1Q2MEV2_9BACT|nr:Modification methylase DpnIIB [Limihaloglobus sulfuriphilus]
MTYFDPLITDLFSAPLNNKVRELDLGLLEYQDIIWYKYNNGSAKIRSQGKKVSPSKPNLRNCKEHIIIWSKDKFELPQPRGVKPDITPEEFEEWTYNVWKVHPNTNKNCPHPCTWPEKLCERLIKLFSFPTQVVLDPFCGSGTTCLSAKNLNRSYTGIEQNPNYCQWAKDRVEGKDMDMELAKFLLSVKSELEAKLGIELVDKKYGRYFKMAKPTDSIIAFSKSSVEKSIIKKRKIA